MSSLIIEGTEIRTESPEGKSASMSLDAFFERVAGRPAGFLGTILPDGIKSVVSDGPAEIWIHQRSPQVYRFKWITGDSPAKFGKGAEYRTVRIALPYLITLAVFTPGPDGKLTLSGQNECFFATQSLTSWEDELCFPALLNCSKFKQQEGNPLAWICSQFIRKEVYETEPDTNNRMRLAFGELMRCLLETGFNYSSEHHEGSSWYSESKDVDPRIATVESWEKATGEDELFVLDVPWLKTGLSIGQIVERCFTIQQAARPDLNNADALARLVFNQRRRRVSPFSPPTESPDNIPF